MTTFQERLEQDAIERRDHEKWLREAQKTEFAEAGEHRERDEERDIERLRLHARDVKNVQEYRKNMEKLTQKTVAALLSIADAIYQMRRG